MCCTAGWRPGEPIDRVHRVWPDANKRLVQQILHAGRKVAQGPPCEQLCSPPAMLPLRRMDQFPQIKALRAGVGQEGLGGLRVELRLA